MATRAPSAASDVIARVVSSTLRAMIVSLGSAGETTVPPSRRGKHPHVAGSPEGGRDLARVGRPYRWREVLLLLLAELLQRRSVGVDDRDRRRPRRVEREPVPVGRPGHLSTHGAADDMAEVMAA